MFEMETRLARAKAGLGPRAADLTDRSPWDWYAQSCPCPGVPGPDMRPLLVRRRRNPGPPELAGLS